MKKLLLLCCLFGLSFSKAQKVAHIDFDSLVTKMPETKKVREQAEKMLADINKTMFDMDGELKKQASIYLEKKEKMPDAERAKTEEQLGMMQQKIQYYREQSEADYQSKIAQLSAPLVEKAKKAIEAVAKEKGYKYVFDLSGRILYSEPGDNILNLTEKKLATMPEAKIPGNEKEEQKKQGGR